MQGTLFGRGGTLDRAGIAGQCCEWRWGALSFRTETENVLMNSAIAWQLSREKDMRRR